MTRRRWIGIIILGVAALLLLGRIIANAYAEYQWYIALGALPVWRVRMRTLLLMRGVAFVVWSVFLFLNFYAVRRSVAAVRVPRRVANLEIGEDLPGRYLDLTALALALSVAALLSWSYTNWMRATLAWNGLPFGEIAPPFELDLGFYVYWLPFETALRDSALVGLIITIGLVLLLYALTPSLRRTGGRLYISNYVRRHLFVLGALVLVVLAWTFRLDAHGSLIDGSGPDGLFTAADRRGVIPVNLTLSLLTLAVAALVLWTGWTGQLRIAFTVIGLLLLGALIAREVAPRTAAASAARAAEADAGIAGSEALAPAERPFAAMRAVYTRRAYGVDRLTPLGTDANAPTSDRAAALTSAWDPSALTRAASRLAGGAPHRVGWSVDGGLLDAVVPVAPDSGARVRVWSVARLAAPLADAGGEVVPRVEPALANASVVTPRIIDGATGSLLVPGASDAVVGAPLDARRSRLALAWSTQNYALLSQPAGTRIMLERDPRELVRRIAPFFQQGSTLFPVVDRDTLYWVIELYATSTRYPLSHVLQFGERSVRYAHHAATAIVNGTSGYVQVVLADQPDPMTRSWARLAPGVFSTWTEVRASLADALPPAIDGARLQATALALAGTRADPAAGGSIPPDDDITTELLAGDPTLHGIFVGPEARRATAWTLPVLDRQQRVRAAVIAVGGRLHASRLLTLGTSGERWPVIRESLRRALDTIITVPREARVVHGPARSVPLPDGLIVAQSAYLWRGDAPPALLGVAVRERTGAARAGASIPAALGVVLAPPPAEGGALRGDSLEVRIRELYAAMEAALARGDLAAFGIYFDSLGLALGRAPRR